MASWNPAQYGTFLDLRTRPSRDLAQRIPISPQRIVDLGCGPGNSTAVCAERWPTAFILGLDSSPEMIESARTTYPDGTWLLQDIGEWIRQSQYPGEPVDLIFSCAALQWVENHARVFPHLLQKLSPGGVLAVQMPAYDAIPNQVMRDMAASERWQPWFSERPAREWRSHSLEFYYAVLTRSAKWLDLWATDYLQVMSDLGAIVDWYQSTGLRPYLDCFPQTEPREEFLDEFRSRLSAFYTKSEAGVVPFSFRRLFLVAGV